MLRLIENLPGSRRVKLYVVRGFIIGLLLFLVYWISTHAFMEITLENPAAGGVSYQITSQQNQETATINNAPTKIKRLVKKGDYEILVKQGESSYFSVIRTSGFLTKKTIETKIEPEKARKFVGDNPAACMDYRQTVLISFNCYGGALSDTQLHTPATVDQPTFTVKNPDASNNTIEGLVKTAQESLILLLESIETADGGVSSAEHAIYVLRDDLSLGNRTVLADLSPEKSYEIKAYNKGFLAYDESFESVYYYESTTAKPLAININNSLDESFEVYSSDMRGQSILIAYSNVSEDILVDEGPQEKNPRYELSVLEGDTTKKYVFTNERVQPKLCGSNKLCVLLADTKQLEVYDLGTKNQKPIYKVSGVKSVERLGNNLLVTRDNEILELDVDNQRGFTSYSFGDYRYCGITTDNQGYSLCVTNSKQKNVALYIDQRGKNIDSIDKKIAKLLKYPEISDISIYETYIYISPEVGPFVYNPSTNSDGPDIVATKRINGVIEDAVTQAGIDSKIYKIINPYSYLGRN